MRHLILPACICLLTLSGSAGADSASTVEQISGAASDNTSLTHTPETTASIRDEASAYVAPKVADVPIDIPPQSAAEDTTPPLARRKATAKRVVARSDQAICDTLTEAARSNDLPIPFFIRLLFQESGFKHDVVSHAGAQGIAQFMPETAASVGLDNPFDPVKAVAASARLLRDLAQKFGNLGLAAAAYNAGPRRIQDWLAKKGKLPNETKNYVKKITGHPAEKWTGGEAGALAREVPREAPCQGGGLFALNSPQRGASPSTRRARISRTMSAAIVKPSARKAVDRLAKAGKNAKGAVQLAATRKKGPRKTRLSQR